MIEIDAIMVSASREYLPSWNSCADIAGSTPNCFDEPRVDLRLEDALAWFISHFRPGVAPSEEEKFDVSIMDAL
jgi:spermidine synthase